MIDRIHIENYKALKDVTIELKSMHVLIGPNDSGKTSILSALATLCRSADMHLEQAFLGYWEGRELVWRGSVDGLISLTADMVLEGKPISYSLSSRFASSGRSVVIQSERYTFEVEVDCRSSDHDRTLVQRLAVGNQTGSPEQIEACKAIHRCLSGVQYYRWNPRMLALPVAPDSTRRFRMNFDGFGLALFLDDILGFDRKRFGELEESFCAIFPEIESIKLSRQSAFRSRPDDREQVTKLDQAEGKGIYFGLRGGGQHLIPAAQASDGVLLILAYLAVLHSPEPPALILVEEPEKGVHPKRLREVLAILRKLVETQSHTQVVLTTHSPYAIDLFEPEQVTLCTKNADGSIAVKQLSESEAVKEQQGIFTLGEIWTAEGDEHLANGARIAERPATP